MAGRRALLALTLAVGLALPLPGCGWEPLYADPQSGPTSADLRAIEVTPIADRIGQRLEMALRNSLNPTGEPTRVRYTLYTTLVRRAAPISACNRKAPRPSAGSIFTPTTTWSTTATVSIILNNSAARAELVRVQPQPVFDCGRRGRRPGSQRCRAEPGDRDAADPVHAARRSEPAEDGLSRGQDRPGAARGVSAAPRPGNPRGAALRPRCGAGARARRPPRPHRLPGSARPVPRRRSDRCHARRRSGAPCRRSGAAEPGRRAPGGAGARRRGRAGPVVRRLSRRHAGRCAHRRRGRRARRRIGAAARVRRLAAGRRDRLLSRHASATVPR